MQLTTDFLGFARTTAFTTSTRTITSLLHTAAVGCGRVWWQILRSVRNPSVCVLACSPNVNEQRTKPYGSNKIYNDHAEDVTRGNTYERNQWPWKIWNYSMTWTRRNTTTLENVFWDDNDRRTRDPTPGPGVEVLWLRRAFISLGWRIGADAGCVLRVFFIINRSFSSLTSSCVLHI